MAELYNKVKKIIEANTIEEAENLMYGANGLQISSAEYYQNIISNFVRKKEYVIPKINDEILFDIDKNINDIWDIVFISQFIQQYWEDEIENINQLKRTYREKEKTETNFNVKDEIKQKIAELEDNKRIINQYFQSLNKKKELNKIKCHTNRTYNEENIEIEILELKKALLIMQKLRDSLQHQNENTKIGNIVVINNEKNRLEVKIPIEYLDGFNKGRIIVGDSEKVVVEKTNTVVSSIFEELGYDIKKIESFFYNINPNYLNFLLEQVNYDYNKLYKLRASIFNNEKKVRLFLKNNISLEYLNTYFNKYFEFYPDSIIKLYNHKIDVTNLPSEAFKYPEATTKLCGHNINVTNLPPEAFKYPEAVIKLYDYGVDITKLAGISFALPDITIELCNLGVDVENMKNCTREQVYQNWLDNRLFASNFVNDLADNMDKLIVKCKECSKSAEKLKNHGIDITRLKDWDAFILPESTIKLYDKGIDVTKLPAGAIQYPEATIKLCDHNIDVTKLPIWAIEHPEKVIKLYDKGIDVTNIPDGFLNSSEAVEAAIMFKKYGLNIRKLPYIATIAPKQVIMLHTHNLNVTKLPPEAFEYPKEAIRFHNHNIDVTKLTSKAFEYPDIVIKLHDDGIDVTKLPPEAFKYPESTIKLHDYQIDITKLPLVAFENPETTMRLYDDGIDITRYSQYSIFSDEKGMYNYFKLCEKNGIDTNKIPAKLYSHLYCTNYSDSYRAEKLEKGSISEIIKEFETKIISTKAMPKIDNIKYLLEINDYNYDKLEELPAEFFFCDLSLVDEMYKTYNLNLCRSIFGIKNPKIISTLVYMNTVFSKYSKLSKDYDKVDIDPIKVIHASFNDSYIYKNNMDCVNMNQETYLNQFILKECKDKEGNIIEQKRTNNEIKNYILDKLRNSSAHFRFKIVKDKEGNIKEDKIYLYDEDNKGVNNFNIVMDVNEILNLTRQVELGINKEKVISIKTVTKDKDISKLK